MEQKEPNFDLDDLSIRHSRVVSTLDPSDGYLRDLGNRQFVKVRIMSESSEIWAFDKSTPRLEAVRFRVE